MHHYDVLGGIGEEGVKFSKTITEEFGLKTQAVEWTVHKLIAIIYSNYRR